MHHCSQPFGPCVQTDINVTGLVVKGPRVSICPRAPSHSVLWGKRDQEECDWIINDGQTGHLTKLSKDWLKMDVRESAACQPTEQEEHGWWWWWWWWWWSGPDLPWRRYSMFLTALVLVLVARLSCANLVYRVCTQCEGRNEVGNSFFTTPYGSKTYTILNKQNGT